MKNGSQKKIGIVIPAYNEEKEILNVIDNVNKKFKGKFSSYNIIVVDDGSDDETAKLASKTNAVVIRHILNMGSGRATATGLSYAYQNNFDVVATLDADGQHDPVDALTGINILIDKNYDLLIGSRLLDNTGMPTAKIIGNKGLSFITYLLFGINLTDSQSGLRIFSKRSLSELKWKTSGYEFCSEMLWRANQLNLKINEFPIKAIYTEYSMTKGQNNWNAFNIIRALITRRIVELFGE